MARAAIDDGHFRIRHQSQDVPGSPAQILHALVTRGVVGDLAEGVAEVRAELAGAMTQVQIFKGVEDCLAHPLKVLVSGEQQG